MELDSFWQLFCKSCSQTENKLGIEESAIFWRNSVIHPWDEMLDIAIFLVIFITELQNSSFGCLCPGMHGRILMAPSTLPDSFLFSSSSQWFAVKPSLHPHPFFSGLKFLLLTNNRSVATEECHPPSDKNGWYRVSTKRLLALTTDAPCGWRLFGCSNLFPWQNQEHPAPLLIYRPNFVETKTRLKSTE